MPQGPSPFTAHTTEPKPDQPSNSSNGKIKLLYLETLLSLLSSVIRPNNLTQDWSMKESPMPPKFSAILGPLKAFNSVANGLADVHPYANVALIIFTCASKADRDNDVSHLLPKMSEVYPFIAEEEALGNIPSMPAIYGKGARQTLEYADFIAHNSETVRSYYCANEEITRSEDQVAVNITWNRTSQNCVTSS
ncbi:uncharacterized protein EDB91DRAFT_123426 [Suillus paluster]|uniref:uncharacterized protein n=1 Tax=Suillus paluster TaxID=48578 RepID=UPI001B87D739|nr:uncharacterized protein EDB91DRAFT_123426 [Suillus paluster]KAG1724630.1 hypothetical protein EDB91DRAFT_123426 [Suillus paluster]